MSAMHKTVKKVSEDIEQMKYNTAIAALMTLLNKIYENGKINRRAQNAYYSREPVCTARHRGDVGELRLRRNACKGCKVAEL